MFPHERSLVKRMEGKPFVLIGVNSDQDKEFLKKQNEKQQITWRSFWCGENGAGGEIPSKWNVMGWPTLYFIDHQGMIQGKFSILGEKDLDAILDKLVAKAEKDAKGTN